LPARVTVWVWRLFDVLNTEPSDSGTKRRKTPEERTEKRRRREEQVLSKLECPVCYGTILPPIR